MMLQRGHFTRHPLPLPYRDVPSAMGRLEQVAQLLMLQRMWNCLALRRHCSAMKRLPTYERQWQRWWQHSASTTPTTRRLCSSCGCRRVTQRNIKSKQSVTQIWHNRNAHGTDGTSCLNSIPITSSTCARTLQITSLIEAKIDRQQQNKSFMQNVTILSHLLRPHTNACLLRQWVGRGLSFPVGLNLSSTFDFFYQRKDKIISGFKTCT